jgi:hypothetical protein
VALPDRSAARAPTGIPNLGWVLATGTFLTLAVVLPVAFAGVRGSAFDDPALGMSMFVTVYSAAHLAALIREARDALIRLTFWLYVYLWLGLAASAQIVSNTFPIPFQSFGPELQAEAMAAAIVGMVAYDVGSLVGRRSRFTSPLAATLDRLTFDPRRVWSLAFIGILYTLYATARDGLAVRFSSRETATNAVFRPAVGQRVDLIQNKAAHLIQIFLLWGPAFLALYLLIYLYRSDRAGAEVPADSRWWFTSLRARRLIGALILANVLANNPQTNPRYRFGGLMIALAVAFWPTSSKSRFRFGALALLGLTIVVFPYAAVFRYNTRSVNFNEPLSRQLATSPDYGMYQQQLNGFIYARTHGHTAGRQLAGAVFSPVPRIFWANKPIDTGNLILRSDIINASADLWTEAQVDFGVAGVIVVLFAYGYVCRAFEDAYRERDQRRATVIGAAVPLFAAFQVFLLRGSLQPAFGELAPIAVVFLCCLRRLPVTDRASIAARATAVTQ